MFLTHSMCKNIRLLTYENEIKLLAYSKMK